MCCFSIFSASSAGAFIVGSGNIISEYRSISNFSKIDIKGAGELYVTQGDEESLKIEAEDNIITLIDSAVEDGTLHLGPKSYAFQSRKPIKYFLIVKNLQSIQSSGETKISAEGLKSNELNIELEGAKLLKLNNIDVKALIVKISGDTRVEASGKAFGQNISVSGSGTFDGKDLQGRQGIISLSGTATIKINTSEKLDIKIYGVGEVIYYGKPQITQTISGSGRITSGDV